MKNIKDEIIEEIWKPSRISIPFLVSNLGRVKDPNKNNELVIQCNGNFEQICTQNNYPANKFFKCLKESIPVYFDIPCGVRTKAIKNDWIKYEGWCLEYLN